MRACGPDNYLSTSSALSITSMPLVFAIAEVMRGFTRPTFKTISFSPPTILPTILTSYERWVWAETGPKTFPYRRPSTPKRGFWASALDGVGAFLRTNREGNYGLHLQGDFDQSCTRPGLVCGPGYRRPAYSVSAWLRH